MSPDCLLQVFAPRRRRASNSRTTLTSIWDLRRGTIDLLEAAQASATKTAYARALVRFQTFANAYGFSTHIPISVQNLALFITSLFNEGLPASSISSILSALSYHHKVRNMADPTRAYTIQKMLVGLKKLRPSVDHRQPLTQILLTKINASLPRLGLSHFESCLYKSMFVLAFFFGLRIGEITDSRHNIQLSQIDVSLNSLTLNFKS